MDTLAASAVREDASLAFSDAEGLSCGIVEPSRRARSREHPHYPRSRRRIRQSGAAVFDRQGFFRPPASGAQGVLSGKAAVPAAAHRHHLEVPRDDRVPRRARARSRSRADRAHQSRWACARHQSDHQRIGAAYRRHEDAKPAAGARSLPLRRRAGRRPARRGKVARQGARVLVPQWASRVGSEAAAPGAVAPLQRPQAPRRELPRISAVELDRTRRLALHRARAHRRGAALFCRAAAGGDARRHP